MAGSLGGQAHHVIGQFLIAIARKETDKDLKVAIIRRLVDMASHSKAAADYLMEVVK